MKNLQKMGGFAALYEAAAYIFGMLGFGLVLDYSSAVDPIQKLALFADNQSFIYLMILFVFVIFGPFLVVLALALYDRLKSSSPGIIQTGTAIGIIWAGVVMASGFVFIIGMNTVVDLYAHDPVQASTVWLAIEAVFEGIGGGNELLGGLWMLLVSWAALRAGEFSKPLNYLGVAIGVVGILSIIPAFVVLTDVFGLTQIIWFIWIGFALMKGLKSPAS